MLEKVLRDGRTDVPHTRSSAQSRCTLHYLHVCLRIAGSCPHTTAHRGSVFAFGASNWRIDSPREHRARLGLLLYCGRTSDQHPSEILPSSRLRTHRPSVAYSRLLRGAKSLVNRAALSRLRAPQSIGRASSFHIPDRMATERIVKRFPKTDPDVTTFAQWSGWFLDKCWPNGIT
jgi:hypothetical protein